MLLTSISKAPFPRPSRTTFQPCFLGAGEGSGSGWPPGTWASGTCRACTARRKEGEKQYNERRVLSLVCLGQGGCTPEDQPRPCPSPASIPSSPCTRCIAGTALLSSCGVSLHSPVPGHARAPSLQKPLQRKSEALRRLCTATWRWSARDRLYKRGKFPCCLLPKHLTRIKASPGGDPISHIETKLFSFLEPLSQSQIQKE